MKYFACGDVVPGCSAKFECANETELFTTIAHHAQSVHGINEVPPALIATIRTLIRDVPAA